jgi:hypothetical protein
VAVANQLLKKSDYILIGQIQLKRIKCIFMILGVTVDESWIGAQSGGTYCREGYE